MWGSESETPPHLPVSTGNNSPLILWWHMYTMMAVGCGTAVHIVTTYIWWYWDVEEQGAVGGHSVLYIVVRALVAQASDLGLIPSDFPVSFPLPFWPEFKPLTTYNRRATNCHGFCNPSCYLWNLYMYPCTCHKYFFDLWMRKLHNSSACMLIN